MKGEFTKEEVRMLKKIAQEKLWFEKVFLTDENGKKYPSGGYSGWVRAMKKEIKQEMEK